MLNDFALGAEVAKEFTDSGMWRQTIYNFSWVDASQFEKRVWKLNLKAAELH